MLPFVSARSTRGGSFAAAPAAPVVTASTALEDVAVVANTSTLEAITGQNEGFIAYNDETFALWVSSEHTTEAQTLYTEQDSGI